MERLRLTRKDKNLTQEELALKIGIKRSTYSSYEKGVRKLPLEKFKRLCIALDVPSDYLLELTNIKTPYNKIQGVIISKEELEAIEK